jgi:hypothetical protein
MLRLAKELSKRQKDQIIFLSTKFIYVSMDILEASYFQNLNKRDVTVTAKLHDGVTLLVFNVNWQLAQNMCKVGQ